MDRVAVGVAQVLADQPDRTEVGTGRARVAAPRRAERGEVVRPEKPADHHAGGDEPDQCEPDRGRGAAQDGAEGDHERGCEDGVGERDDPLGLEAGVEAIAEAVERGPPPGQQQAHDQRCEQRAGDDQCQLGGQPAAACDALRPGQPERALLEFDGEGRGEQDRENSREQGEPGDEAEQPLEAAVERLKRVGAAGGVVRETGADPLVVVDGGDVQSRRDQHGREHDQQGDGDQRLGALLAPGEPDHDATSPGTRAAGTPRPR